MIKLYIYTKRGLYHETVGEASGDVVRSFGDEEVQAAVVSDGVSTCSQGRTGALIASKVALKYLRTQYTKYHFLPPQWAHILLELLVRSISKEATKDKRDIGEYAATMMVMLVDKKRKKLYYCNIGDGLLLTVENGKCPVLSMPQGLVDECPVITTKYAGTIIDSGEKDLNEVKQVVMCTDGAWKKMYNKCRIKPHVKDCFLSGNTKELTSFMENERQSDDCSFAIIEIEG